jgi:hypothetical protein
MNECIRGGTSWPLHRDHGDLLCLSLSNVHAVSGNYSTVIFRRLVLIIQKYFLFIPGLRGYVKYIAPHVVKAIQHNYSASLENNMSVIRRNMNLKTK